MAEQKLLRGVHAGMKLEENLMTRVSNTGAGSAGSKTKLTALFDSRSDAEKAFHRLKNVEVSEIRLIPGFDADDAERTPERQGLWGKLEDWLSDEDRAIYTEGLRRGGYFVSVEVGNDNYDLAHAILDDEGTVDLEERMHVWRTEGWDEKSLGQEVNTTSHGTIPATPEETRRQQYEGERGDVFAAEETSKQVPQYARRHDVSSRRVRSYDLLTSELADGPHLRDDILPTGHLLSVEEGEDHGRQTPDESRDLDQLRREQNLNKGR